MCFPATYNMPRPTTGFETAKLQLVTGEYLKMSKACSHFLGPHHFWMPGRMETGLHPFSSYAVFYRTMYNLPEHVLQESWRLHQASGKHAK